MNDGSIERVRGLRDERAGLMYRSGCVGYHARSGREVQGDGLAGLKCDDIVAGLYLHGCSGVIDESKLNGLRLSEHGIDWRMDAGCRVNGRGGDERGGEGDDCNDMTAIHS